MTTQYRLLNEGETIQDGDEYYNVENGVWRACRTSVRDTAKGNMPNDLLVHRPITGQIIDLPKIDGYEYTGEYRAPKLGDFYLPEMTGKDVLYANGNGDTDGHKRHILRKIEKPKTYRPFKDYEEMKPHRERMVVHKNDNQAYPLWFVYAQNRTLVICTEWVFEDTGFPVGVYE